VSALRCNCGAQASPDNVEQLGAFVAHHRDHMPNWETFASEAASATVDCHMHALKRDLTSWIIRGSVESRDLKRAALFATWALRRVAEHTYECLLCQVVNGGAKLPPCEVWLARVRQLRKALEVAHYHADEAVTEERRSMFAVLLGSAA
jgi:hypothetical protein